MISLNNKYQSKPTKKPAIQNQKFSEPWFPKTNKECTKKKTNQKLSAFGHSLLENL